MRLAGIKDVYSVTGGKIRTTINLAKACINALNKTKEMLDKTILLMPESPLKSTLIMRVMSKYYIF